MANEVAKGYPADGRTVVSMYAYGDGPTNVLAPRFALRKNVYPVVIPYAFQTAYPPAEMVKTWAGQVGGTMGLYDYWNITQWSQGLPQFDVYSIKDKLRFWRDHKVDGFYAETTDAAGPMGHAWWLAGQLLFDLDQDFEPLYRRYLTDLFGPAAPPMRKMYDRWSRSPQGAGEVGLSLADLHAADALVPRGGPEWNRINELKADVHFMKLLDDHDNTQAGKDRLFEYPPQYLYVPKDCREIVFEDSIGAAAQAPSFFLPGDKAAPKAHATSLGVKHLYRVEVRPEWRGRVIAAQFAHTNWSLRNLPNVLALQPFAYAE